ncbi:sodium channel protein 60E-like [Actinia tenebrosa]|uniref:Sodium channel protein 60E-like n=1 Tax=Actinia tenebrosa TaxID=6105 RepID=A0A6P8IVI1_ACTTE|nr:sodium channel protein 60E-like [Actinia tenebrosa]XP_031570123.1 sodium channel protein 60E-like [Actinia tenebrosa]XP_031570124.1 sodium channel protein 60E-like [Actinia tenebrosa]XP_031570125.1 sodium channel protein 60E-like [Actinia tenebrosa]
MLNRGNFTSIIAQSPLRAKMPKDDEDEEKDEIHKPKRVRFAANDIHHEVDEEPDEEKPIRRKVPSYIIGHPLADYDATEGSRPSEETYIVLSTRLTSSSYQAYRYNLGASLWCLSPVNPLRILTIRIVTHPFFEMFVMVVILVNCIILALNDPPEEAEYIFTAIYTLEMLLKIISRGFILHTYAYLRDSWNWLDFIVVFLSYLSIAPNIASFSGIRTLRVLRAFRTISALKGLRTMVNSLLRSLKLLTDVLVLFMFSLCVLALIGLQLFSGELRNKCVQLPLPNTSIEYVRYINNASNWYSRDDEPLICGNSSIAGGCPVNYTCLSGAGPNPDHGYTNFDNMGWALVMAFQILTMDFWENLYDKCLRSMGAWYIMYFVVGIFSCSFYLLNLVLAVVYMSYHHEMLSSEDEEVRRKQNKKKAMSYSADQDTLRRLEPLERHLYPPDYEEEEEEKEHDEDETNAHEALIGGSQISNSSCERNGRLKILHSKMSKFVERPLFDGIVTALILLNTVVLSMYYHGMSPDLELVLDILNAIFTGIFLLEMMIKILVVGFWKYVCNKWNLFDGIIILASVVAYFQGTSTGISMFRILRLLRVLYLGRSWETMAKLIQAIAHSVDPILNITCILGVIIYVFAVMGMRIFGPAYTEEKFGAGQVPRWNLKDFSHSFMMVFRILCSEWVEPLWDCMRVTDAAALLFFLPCLIVGNFIVLNLFVALLLNSFAIKENETIQKEEKPKRKRRCRLTETKKTRMYVATFRERYKLYQVKVLESSRATEPGIGSPLQERYSDVTPKGHKIENINLESISQCGSDSCASSSNVVDRNKNPSPKRYIIEIDDCFPQCCMICYCPSGQHFCWLKFRCRVRCFVEHRYFEWFILFTVMISSFILVFEDVHLPEKPNLQRALEMLNFIFAIIFSLEFFLKVIGFGLVKYFSSVWNCLDALIVSVSVACLFGNPNLSVFRSFRTIRALRPLRAISRLGGMRVVINALFAAIPGIGNVLVISILFWLMFSILGVQLFAGKFFRCVDENNERLPTSVAPNRTSCLNQTNYRWVNANVNFDNVCNGFLALLQVATYEGWMEVMADAVDSTEVDQQPMFENNMLAYVYFVGFIIVGSFFVLNLFVGVIIDNFNTLKKKYEEISSMGMFLTESQRKWVQILVAASRRKPPSKTIRPSDCFRGKIFDLVTSNKFEIFILTVIMINMGLMMVQHYRQPEDISNVMKIANFVLVGIFLFEAIIKLIPMRHHYFKKAWNIFDFIVVVSSVVGIVLDEMNTQSGVVNAGLLRVIRVFRVARLLRVVQFAKRIRQLLVAIIISIPALFNIGTLLFLIMYIYAIIGMASFGNVKKQGELDDFVNFQTFGKSMMLIFRLSTGTGWNDILDALMVQPPNCDPNYQNLPNGNCGYVVESVFYLVSYIVVVFLIIVNMYIAVLLDNVNRAHESDEFGLSKEKFKSYYHKFANFSLGKQYIPVYLLSDFLSDLDKPFRIPKPNDDEIKTLAIPVREGNVVHCFDVLKALVKRTLQEHGESPEAFEQITVRMEAQFKKSFSKKVSVAIIGSTMLRFHSTPIKTTNEIS